MFKQLILPRIVRPIEQAPYCLSLEEVALCAGHKVLMEADDNLLPIIGDPHWILHEYLRPRTIHLLNIIIILINCIKLYTI